MLKISSSYFREACLSQTLQLSMIPARDCAVSEISISDIQIDDSDIDQEEIQKLADSIDVVGLLSPVIVSRDKKRLIAGRGRFEACKRRGITKIPAIIRDCDKTTEELIQIDENLIRKHLSALQEGELFLRRDKLLTELGVRSKAGENQHTRRGGATVAPPKKTTKDIARDLGMGERNLQLKKQIARDLADTVKQKLRKTPLANSVRGLLEISKLPPKQQAALAPKLSGNEQFDALEKKIHKIVRQEKVRKMHMKARKFKGIEGFEFHMGDFFDICAQLADNSIDQILTDPPYPPKFLHLWKKLGVMAYQKLRPGGFLVVYVGKNYLPTVINYLLESGLQYYWMITIAYLDNHRTPTIDKNVFEATRPILIFQKPPFKAASHAFTDLISCKDEQEKDFHPWQQHVNHSRYLITRFSEPNDLILDPFAGSGTVALAAFMEKRRCISVDIDKKNIKTAMGRIQEEQEKEHHRGLQNSGKER